MLKRLIGRLLPGGAGAARAAAPAADGPPADQLGRARDLLSAGAADACLEAADGMLAAHPASPQALTLAADALLALGRPAEAVLRAQAALRHGAPGVDAHMSLAQALSRLGEDEEAVLAMRQGEDRDPLRADFWNEFGLLHLRLGNLDMARGRLRRAAALDPKLASPWINLAILEQRAGSQTAAVPYLKRAISCDPADGLAWSNLGLALRDSERVAEAESALRRAAELRPGHAQTRVNLASVLLDQGRAGEADVLLEEALALEPGLVTALVAAAGVALQRGDEEAAERRYREALAGAPDDALVLSALGELELRRRDFASGWDHYEHRFGPEGARRFPFPRWRGEPLGDGALLVHSEQGIGDMMLFASCFGELRALRAVVLEAPERLLGLFRRSFPWATVMPYAGDELPSWLDEVPPISATIPAGSLMGLYRRSADAFPRHEGYLVADPERVARWRARLATLGPGPKIGISWRGGYARTGRVARSTELSMWHPVVAMQGAHLVSLQYTRDAAAEVAACNARYGTDIVHWPEAIEDYEETAALTAALDAVVTVCTAAAHLAGALGRPAWIAAPAAPSWRYLGKGSDLPWYPSARVLRLRPGAPWGEVIAAAADAVATRFGLSVPAMPVAGTPAVAATTAADGASEGASGTTKAATESVEERARRLVREGDAGGAIESLEALLADRPDWAAGYALLARAYASDGERESALDCIELALHHDPGNLDALLLACEINESLNRLDPAIAALERVVEAGSAGLGRRAHLARLRYRNREYLEAERMAAELLAEDPQLAEALYVLGLSRIAMEDYAGAVDPLERLLVLRPASTVAQHNLAVAYLHRGRLEEAGRLWSWVLAREPNNYDASWTSAFIELGYHRFETGWTHYERRRHLPDRRQITANLPRWHGQPEPDRTLLVLAEQGLGDEIMFASCVGEALERCGRLVMTCDRRLMRLFERSFPGVRTIDSAVVRGSDVADADMEVLAGSLPAMFRRSLDAFPDHHGYLRADPARVAYWRERLDAMGPGPKLGLSWRGGTPTTRARLRTLSPGDLLPLLHRADLRFVSLQYGAVEDELAALRAAGIEIPHYPEVIPDYDETAALVTALDGVVSVCTSLIHLAGALGRPAHVLVPSVPEWRYGVQGARMPWYPSVTLYRQRQDEPWSDVVLRLLSGLSRGA